MLTTSRSACGVLEDPDGDVYSIGSKKLGQKAPQSAGEIH